MRLASILVLTKHSSYRCYISLQTHYYNTLFYHCLGLWYLSMQCLVFTHVKTGMFIQLTSLTGLQCRDTSEPFVYPSAWHSFQMQGRGLRKRLLSWAGLSPLSEFKWALQEDTEKKCQLRAVMMAWFPQSNTTEIYLTSGSSLDTQENANEEKDRL